MKSKHITNILDHTKFADLSEQDKMVISTHIEDCSGCRRAYKAARLSAVLLESENTIAQASPSPFFQAKVMNAWRERQLPRRPVEAFRRWWQASAMPVSVMLVTMVIMILLTVIAPQASNNGSQEISSFNLYTTDGVIMNQRPELTNEQIFEVIYTTRNEVRNEIRK
jgi:predicted anti-sigma-YlaC factor YlaD